MTKIKYRTFQCENCSPLPPCVITVPSEVMGALNPPSCCPFDETVVKWRTVITWGISTDEADNATAPNPKISWRMSDPHGDNDDN